MTTGNLVVNRDERIATVREIVDGEETVFYAIRDVYLNCWRSTRPLNGPAAWTRDRRRRAEFKSRGDAFQALHRIWRMRGRVEVDESEIEQMEKPAA